MSELDPFKVFLKLQLGLPRNGPGSAKATARAFAMLPGLPENAQILDIGCGQGASTFELLKLTDEKSAITALNLYEPFLEKLNERATAQNIPDERLIVKRGDMTALPFAPQTFDLIWSEGAIYLLGFGDGLRNWRDFVKPGGLVVVSECTWLTDEPSQEVRLFWEAAYPEMGTIAENSEAADRAGYDLIGTYVQTADDWEEEYYSPMRRKITEMTVLYGDEVRQVLEEAKAEITLYERNPGQYSYVFYVLRRRD